MGRIYYIDFAGTITNANGDVDLVEILPADDKPCKVRGFLIGQTTEIAEAQEEQIDVRLLRLTATVTGSNGTAFTPVPVDEADAAAGFAAETIGTTVATTTGSTRTWRFPWNLRNTPLEIWFPDERFAPKIKQGEGGFLRVSTAVTDDVGIAGWVCVEEE